MRSKPAPPMTLANMRANEVRAVTATCEACGHKADVNVDALPETVTVPKAGQRLRCSSCGGKTISTRHLAYGPARWRSRDAANGLLTPSRRRRAPCQRWSGATVSVGHSLGHRAMLEP